MPISKKIIKSSFDNFKKERFTDHRYASFDYCFGYFQSFENKKDIEIDKNLEMSCLHLGFYLASWGMLRASSILLQKSLPFYKDIIKIIAKDCEEIWEIDVHNYMENNNIDKLIKLYDKLVDCIPDNHRTLVIVTKIMMGVFGCCPAFDNNFAFTFRTYYGDVSKFYSFDKKALQTIYNFYFSNHRLIDNLRNNCKVINFKTGKDTKLLYSRAKVIDMIGFQLGLEHFKKEKLKNKK